MKHNMFIYLPQGIELCWTSHFGVFVGGLVVFSPTILPIVPFYLSYMAGTGINVLSDDGELPPEFRAKRFCHP